MPPTDTASVRAALDLPSPSLPSRVAANLTKALSVSLPWLNAAEIFPLRALPASTALILPGCGSGSSGGGGSASSSSTAKRLKGQFIDSPVEGMLFSSADLSGLTDSQGLFRYRRNTTVTFSLGDIVFGKPVSRQDALEMLTTLSGRSHTVLSAVAVWKRGKICTTISESTVRFRAISPHEAAEYWQSGEPRDKAGSYAIQGKGGIFVEALSGSYSGVVGLPVFETVSLLSQAGILVLAPTGT